MPDFRPEPEPVAASRVVSIAPEPAAWTPTAAAATPTAGSVAPEPAPPATPEPGPAARGEPTQVVITEADPGRPRKAGWWQRVRTPFGG